MYLFLHNMAMHFAVCQCSLMLRPAVTMKTMLNLDWLLKVWLVTIIQE